MTDETLVKTSCENTEKFILGSMLCNIENASKGIKSFSENDFHHQLYKKIFKAIRNDFSEKNEINLPSISKKIEGDHDLNGADSFSFIQILQLDGQQVHFESQADDLKSWTAKRLLATLTKSMVDDLKMHVDPFKIIEKAEDSFQSIKKSQSDSKNTPQIVSIHDRLSRHNEMLKGYRGKKHLGLRVKTIEELNERMLGIRKLVLLAAPPNVGKTAITIQIANEVLLKEPDACLVYVSLEMDAEEIFTRMNLYLSGLDFKTYALGSQQAETEEGYQNYFSPDELRRMNNASETIKEIGNRLQIIDLKTYPNINADTIIDFVDRVKKDTKCTRAIVIVDYLQVLPIPHNQFSSDIEADKWRIGELKRIRDALNTHNQDPVIVISEARKPTSSGDEWGGDLSDVMGAARGTYSPDAVWLLNQSQPKLLKKLWEGAGMKPPSDYGYVGNEKAGDGSDIQAFLAHHGIAICSLKMPKGRDGMERFNISLAFHFRRNKFEKVDWQAILGLAMEEKNKRDEKNNPDEENKPQDPSPAYNRGRNFKGTTR